MWRPGAPPPPSTKTVTTDALLRGSAASSADSFVTLVPSSSSASSSLPIKAHRRQILHALEQHSVVVVVGETGSGKSTQLVQYLHQGGWTAKNFQVVCTQPRRLAAITLAHRVSEEMAATGGAQAGSKVAYAVRFEDTSTPGTAVKFVTDGLLVRETLLSPLLSQYSVVIVDEAHERNLNQDIMFGLLKKIQSKRPSLRIVICSATINAEAFQTFFQVPNKPQPLIISVDGRQHPVETLYLAAPCADYVRTAVDTALRLHAAEPAGDILVFLPTAEDIESAIRLAEDLQKSYAAAGTMRLNLLPLYAALPYHMQTAPFQKSPPNVRKVIFATTIAETSVTLPDVTLVVDCGFVKQPYFDSKKGFERLLISSTSKSSAKQRAGRAGRTAPGKCFRLFTRDAYEQFDTRTPPEITRTSLSNFVLTLKTLGVDNIMSFDMLSSPSVNAMCFALEELFALGAIDEKGKLVLGVGDLMGEFPVEVKFAKMLMESVRLGCTEECITIAAVSQVQSIFHFARSGSQKRERDAAIGSFVHETGDHLTAVRIMRGSEWRDAQWCKDNFLNVRALQKVGEITDQLRRFMLRMSGGGTRRLPSLSDDGSGDQAVLKALVKGLVFNVARMMPGGKYKTVRGNNVVEVSPYSVYADFGRHSEYVVFEHTEDNPRKYGLLQLVGVSAIDGNWLRGEGGGGGVSRAVYGF
jgi:ATP-dependent RNA helicase DDX35